MQLSFLEDDNRIEVTVIDYGDRFEARILDGWFMAIGETKEEAIKNVVARYETETSYR